MKTTTEFIEGARKQIAEELGVSFHSTREIDTNGKAEAALKALIEWKLIKLNCQGRTECDKKS